MKLVVGLGNPGKEYSKTRHNIGYLFLDYLIGEDKFNFNKKFRAYEYEDISLNEKVLFIKPTSFMNLSGEVVNKYIEYYNLGLNDVFVIQDDLDMAVGKYKLMYNRGDGGHNGIKNIILNVGSKEFLRLKIGISNNKEMDTKDYVLGKFNKEELKILDETFDNLKSIVEDYINMNRDVLFGKYNSKK